MARHDLTFGKLQRLPSRLSPIRACSECWINCRFLLPPVGRHPVLNDNSVATTRCNRPPVRTIQWRGRRLGWAILIKTKKLITRNGWPRFCLAKRHGYLTHRNIRECWSGAIQGHPWRLLRMARSTRTHSPRDPGIRYLRPL